MVLRALHELAAPPAGQLKALKMIQSARISAETCYSTRWFFYEWRWEFEIASAVIKLPTVVM